ncbi:MAG: hypothetical protein HYV09_36345 [Deltaproteobacteria bacterium]|nr:hypothetical protein [Deltaproteobacteria bacterium]
MAATLLGVRFARACPGFLFLAVAQAVGAKINGPAPAVMVSSLTTADGR